MKVDIKNAYNSIRRDAALEQVRIQCPEAYSWSRWCLTGSNWLFLGKHVVECKTGVQQGDPLAPLLFSLGLHQAVEALADVPGLCQLWYLDDGALSGPAPVVSAAFSKLQVALAKLGLHLNLAKCEIYKRGPTSIGGHWWRVCGITRTRSWWWTALSWMC